MRVKWLPVVLALAGACTKPNPEVCCLDPADCTAAGIPEDRRCTGDLVCINHSCQEAPDAAPPECTDASACMDPLKAFCDATTQVCRGCIADDECDSGACGDDGACVAESEILYVSPTAQPAVTACTRAEPCSIQVASMEATTVRFTYVLAPGTYNLTATLSLNSVTRPNIVRADLHGHRARLVKGSAPPTGVAAVEINYAPTTIRDLEILGQPDAPAIRANNAVVTLRRVTLAGKTGLSFGPGTLTIDGSVILGSETGIGVTSTPTTVSITNLLSYGASNGAINLGGATGRVSHSTVANSGLSTTIGAQGINCGAAVTLHASIVWTPGGSQPPISGCSVDNVIAGPFPVLGARSTDPGFANGGAQDFHLSATSVARDAADDGPAVDFEGDPRPQGARFDLGADEASP